jgi:plastocyanin
MKARVLALAGLAAAAALGAAPASLAAPALAPLPLGVVVAGPGAFATTFATPAVVVPAGTPLTFVNADAAGHSVVSVDFDGNGRPLFSSDIINTGGTAPVNGTAALAPGSYAFVCGLHPNMTGSLTVV